MSAPEVNNIMSFGDQMIYHMTQVYASASTANPPVPTESWKGLAERLAYYLTRGVRFP